MHKLDCTMQSVCYCAVNGASCCKICWCFGYYLKCRPVLLEARSWTIAWTDDTKLCATARHYERSQPTKWDWHKTKHQLLYKMLATPALGRLWHKLLQAEAVVKLMRMKHKILLLHQTGYGESYRKTTDCKSMQVWKTSSISLATRRFGQVWSDT